MTNSQYAPGSAQDPSSNGLPVVYVHCPAGHKTGTQKASGSQMRCSRCFQELGKTVLVAVPARAPASPPPDPVRPPARCRSCGAQAPPGRYPDGWLTVMVSADPVRTKDGKPFRRLGPWCSLACAVGALRGETGQMAGVTIRPGETADLRALMTEAPRGRP
jgi:hypothetical protein